MTTGSRIGPDTAIVRRRFDAVLGLVIALGAAVRFVGIGAQSLWYDEVSTRVIVTTPIAHLFNEVRIREGTPPLYYALAAVWTRVVGTDDAKLRSFSAIVGTLAIPVVYAVVRELGLTRRAARIAASLVAVNPFLVWYSQEARAYSLLVLCAALTMLAFARAWTLGRTIDCWYFGAAAALALAVHYFALFFVAPATIALLIERRGSWRRVLAGLIPLGVVATPLGFLALDQQSHNLQQWIGDWSLEFRLRESGRHLLIGPIAPRAWLWVVVAGAGLIGIGLAVGASDRLTRHTARVLIAIGTSAALLPALTAAVDSDYFLDRNVIAALVPLTIAVAIGLGGVRARTLGSVAVVGVMAVSITTTVAVSRDRDLQRADWRAISGVIARHHGRQLVVMNRNRVLGSTMSRYLPPTRELSSHAIVKTRDVVFIGLGSVPGLCAWWFGHACSIVYLSERPQVPLPRSFHLVHIDHVGRFTLARYRSASAARLGLRTLVTPQDRAGSMVLVVIPAVSHSGAPARSR